MNVNLHQGIASVGSHGNTHWISIQDGGSEVTIYLRPNATPADTQALVELLNRVLRRPV